MISYLIYDTTNIQITSNILFTSNMHLTASGSYWYSKTIEQWHWRWWTFIFWKFDKFVAYIQNIYRLTQLILIFTLKHLPWTYQNLGFMKISPPYNVGDYSPIIQVISKPSRKIFLIELTFKNDDFR